MRGQRVASMLVLAAVIIGAGIAFLPNLTDHSGSQTSPTTTFDPIAIMEESSPYKCAQSLELVVADMVDTRQIDPALRAWGANGPAFRAASMLFAIVYPLVYQEGERMAAQRLSEGAVNLCFDGDVANDVLALSSGDVGFMRACLDGQRPVTIDDNCAARP